jgi:hypothetical protein
VICYIVHYHLFVFAQYISSNDFLSAFAMQTYSYNVVDDKKSFSDNLSRITSNDSGISYDDSDDNESLFSNEYDFDFIDPLITITDDGI